MNKFLKAVKSKFAVNYYIVSLLLIFGVVLLFMGNLRPSSANLLTQIGYSIILAVSLNLIVGFLGELSLGHAGFMCVGAYIGGYFATMIKEIIPSKLTVLILSMIVGGLVAAVFGFIIGLPSLRLKGDYLAIVTLAFGEIVRNIFKNQKLFGGAMGLSTGSVQYDTRRSPTLFIVVLAVVLIMLFVVQNFIKSKHGRAVTAIRDNEIAAKSMGINVTFYKLFVFILAAFFAGVAGVIYSHYVSPVLYTFFSYNYSIEILVMVVLGGMGNITGSIISAILIPCINFLLQNHLSGDLAALRYLIYALVLILIVIFSNAPAFKKFRDALNISAMIEKRRAHNPANRKEDEATWSRIPTKIKMDALLSTDVNLSQGIKEAPDAPPRNSGKSSNGGNEL